MAGLKEPFPIMLKGKRRFYLFLFPCRKTVHPCLSCSLRLPWEVSTMSRHLQGKYRSLSRAKTAEKRPGPHVRHKGKIPAQEFMTRWPWAAPWTALGLNPIICKMCPWVHPFMCTGLRIRHVQNSTSQDTNSTVNTPSAALQFPIQKQMRAR